jgi:hypothetical protein
VKSDYVKILGCSANIRILVQMMRAEMKLSPKRPPEFFVSHGSRWRPEGTIHKVYATKVRSHYVWHLACGRTPLPYGELRESIEDTQAVFCKNCFTPDQAASVIASTVEATF